MKWYKDQTGSVKITVFYDFIWAYMTGGWRWTVEDYLSYMASVLVSFNFLCKRSKKSLFVPLQHKGKKMALFQTCFFWFWTGPFTYLDWYLSLPHCCSSTSSNWSQNLSKNFSKLIPNIGCCWLQILSGKPTGRRTLSIFVSSHSARQVLTLWKLLTHSFQTKCSTILFQCRKKMVNNAIYKQ